MTLLFAMKTDKEVYLASDGRVYFEIEDRTEFNIEHKFIRVNDHVEILFAGFLEVARGYYISAQHALWDKGFYERNCDACEIAKALEQEINPSSVFLKEDFPLEIFVGGWDRDENRDFVYPVIYILNNEVHYRKRKLSRDRILGGDPDPDTTTVAGKYFYSPQLTDTINSPVENGNIIYSCFKKTIQEIKRKSAATEIGIGEPIHIARITKDGYELLR